MSGDFQAFAAEIRSISGCALETEPGALGHLTENVGGFRRTVLGALQVRSRTAVISALAAARLHGIPLYPISRGRNWGYGSKLPVTEGCVILDLSGMNRILRVDQEFGFAEIEPGVTQAQLAAELEALGGGRWFLDVTGSGEQTSVLGNALDRGVAYQSLRVEHLSDLEVVLADGSVIQTGFSRMPSSALSGLYAHGIGPSLDGLFFQSNLGVVVRATVKFLPRPERHLSITLPVSTDSVPALLDALKGLKQRDCISGIPHLADRYRLISTARPLVARETGLKPEAVDKLLSQAMKRDWTLTASIHGPRRVVREKRRIVARELGVFGRPFFSAGTEASLSGDSRAFRLLLRLFASPAQRILWNATRRLRGLHFGKPTDDGIRFLLEGGGAEVDTGKNGVLLVTPLGPLRGDTGRRMAEIARRKTAARGLDCGITLNVITNSVLEAVITIHFNKADAARTRDAQRCAEEMTEEFNALGFYPYRVNIDLMSVAVDQSSPYGITLRKLKAALDPQDVLAPGRYIPPSPPLSTS